METKLRETVPLPSTSTEQDLDSLLSLAEGLQRDVQRRTLQKQTYRSLVYIVEGFVAVYMLVAVLPKITFDALNAIGLVAAVGLMSIALYFFESIVRRFQEQVNVDRRALGEVLRLAREVEAGMGESESWSVLKRAEYRIRLSRFDID